MKRAIYINPENGLLITTSKELETLIENRVEELKSEITFDLWLDENYFISEVFDMDEEEKREVTDGYQLYLRAEALSRIKKELIPHKITLDEREIDLENYY